MASKQALNMPEKDQSMDDYIYFEKNNDEAIDIISIENYVTPEEQYANELLMNIKKEIMIYRELN